MNADKKVMRIAILHMNPGHIFASRWAGGLLGVALAASFLSSGCSKGGVAEASPTVTVQVGAAENKNIERKVIGEATLYPLEQAAIVPKISAPVKKFYVEKGSKVHAGQLLAELENRDLLAAQEENRGAYAQAEAGYEQAVQKAKQDLQLSKETLDAAQKLYNARQELYKQGAVSAKDVDDANVALIQARNAYEASQKQLDLKVAEGQLDAAKGQKAVVEVGLNYSRIVSPIDGVVTDRPVYPGEMASNSGPIITVMNLDTDNRPHKKKVKVGIRDAGDVQITEGLLGGERVVTVGAFALSQEDDPVLAKTNIQVAAPPNIPEEDDENQ